MRTAKARGNIGERYSARYLRDKGYNIIGANFNTRFGEIDIIASSKKYIAFVEVKTRSPKNIARPCEAVDFAKQQKIKRTALLYLSQNKTELQPRFDVIEVILDSDNSINSINHIENAFE